jgi:UDP-N-acetylmuramoyl-tripeptide--D-alanyl-D-alanine ligase
MILSFFLHLLFDKIYPVEIKDIYNLYIQSYKVTTDTRADLRHSVFFALKGENFNGNKYATEALKNGANFAIID